MAEVPPSLYMRRREDHKSATQSEPSTGLLYRPPRHLGGEIDPGAAPHPRLGEAMNYMPPVPSRSAPIDGRVHLRRRPIGAPLSGRWLPIYILSLSISVCVKKLTWSERLWSHHIEVLDWCSLSEISDSRVGGVLLTSEFLVFLAATLPYGWRLSTRDYKFRVSCFIHFEFCNQVTGITVRQDASMLTGCFFYHEPITF